MISIISDSHLGTHRQAGTTPASQVALKEYLQDEFRTLVNGRIHNHVIINGDIFDSFSVDPGELISAYCTLESHITNGGLLTLIAGNPDESAKGAKTSSFHLLAFMLETHFPDNVQVVDHQSGLTSVSDGVWSIPHMLNQDLFNIEIDKAIAAKPCGAFLLLHCNVLSPFAEHADHSLNLDQDQIDALIGAGWQMVVGHEHTGKQYEGGKVILPGNQIPSSISDCLGNKNMAKYYAVIDGDTLDLVKWLELDQVYAEINWQDIDTATLECKKFIRVTGDCTAEQAADMVGRVSKLRQASTAFVVSNNVKIEGVAQMEGLAELTSENLARFDVLGALLEELTEAEALVVRELLC